MIPQSRISIIIASMGALALGGAVLAQVDATPDRRDAAVPDEAPAKAAAKPAAAKPTASKPVKQAQAISVPASALSGKPLPNGASSITEGYGNWTVSCRLNEGQKLCTLAQVQGNKQTGQRTFGIDLLPPKGGKTDSTILMPFGLKLDAGATLKLDDKEFGQSLHFSTCIPEGCLLPVSFPAPATEALGKGTTLSVTGVGLGSGQAVTFSISLDGFPAALRRVTDLGS